MAILVPFCLASGLVASGCAVTTTQQKDAWLEVKAERTIYNSSKIRLDDPPEGIELGKPEVVTSKSGDAVAIDVINNSGATINDTPIAVGVKTDDGKKQYLNLERGTPYFESHLGSLADGGETTWVYAAKKGIPDGEVFAQLGTPDDPPLTTAHSLPSVTVSEPSGSSKSGQVSVEVKNDSDIPQYEIQLYAWARDGEHLKAAGTGKLEELEGGQSATVHLKLAGDADGAQVEVSAPPTIFN